VGRGEGGFRWFAISLVHSLVGSLVDRFAISRFRWVGCFEVRMLLDVDRSDHAAGGGSTVPINQYIFPLPLSLSLPPPHAPLHTDHT